jgi:hypothetical protein
MKLSLIILIKIFVLSIIHAQNNSGLQEIIKPPDIDINYSLNYSSIKIIDRRFDTTKIGYVKPGNKYKKIVTEGPLSTILQNHLNNQLKKQLNLSINQNLVIVIKKLWLQQTNTDELDDKKISRTYGSADGDFGMCISAFDIYLQKDSIYVPLLKIDTSLFTLKKLNKDAGYLLGFALENCINQIGSIDLSKFKNRRTLSWPDIEQYNSKRLAYPRYKNDTLMRGIFVTFKDFLNNKPVLKKFIAQSGKLTDELYIEQNGEEVLLEDFWGFCDGQKNYLHLGLNFFEIIRESNAYELLGSKTITEKKRRYAGGGGGSGSPGRDIVEMGLGNAIFTSKKPNVNYKPLQIDMETGKVY